MTANAVMAMAGEMMGPVSTAEADAIETAIPDLRDIPLDRLAALGGTALAHAIVLYRKRAGGGTLAGKFNSCI